MLSSVFTSLSLSLANLIESYYDKKERVGEHNFNACVRFTRFKWSSYSAMHVPPFFY